MIRDLKNPYRRGLMLAAIEEIETEEKLILKALYETLPDLLYNIADVLGTTNVNVHVDKKSRIKHLFERNKKEAKDKETKILKIPKPNGSFDEIEIIK